MRTFLRCLSLAAAFGAILLVGMPGVMAAPSDYACYQMENHGQEYNNGRGGHEDQGQADQYCDEEGY